MSQWHEAVSLLEASGDPYVLVTVMGARGSTPRDSGTKMVVCSDATFGSIGGGHLEYKAIATAMQLLSEGIAEQCIEHFPLGPKLGQCCGGSATLLFESFTGAEVSIMLFGAGHVGRALTGILGQLPVRVHWVDAREEEFPDTMPANVNRVLSDDPAAEVDTMPEGSYYIVMTHTHPLDFAITEAVLKREDAAYVGLIGSATKWQRFQMRFAHRGHDESFYESVRCPVGLDSVPGKLPIEVAVSVAGEVIAHYQQNRSGRDTQQGVSWRELKAPKSSAADEVPTTSVKESLPS
jgi:xanthine dehydrogenase accessory factor